MTGVSPPPDRGGPPAPDPTDGFGTDGLVWERRPRLTRPLMVAAFEGWNDAAGVATDTAIRLAEAFGARRFAVIDPEVHLDYRRDRPRVRLVDGVTRGIDWPANRFLAGPTRGPHDAVLLIGVEPSRRWRSFCRAVLEVVATTGCEMVLTLGALLADVPHTRAPAITGSATDPALVDGLGLARSYYEGPTGIVGALHDECRRAGVPSVSLWAPVPHYLARRSDPAATEVLLTRAGELLGASLDLDGIRREAREWRRRIDDAVAADDDTRAYVRRLEERADHPSAESPFHDPGVSGDDIAAAFERYLRERDAGDDGRGGEGG